MFFHGYKSAVERALNCGAHDFRRNSAHCGDFIVKQFYSSIVKVSRAKVITIDSSADALSVCALKEVQRLGVNSFVQQIGPAKDAMRMEEVVKLFSTAFEQIYGLSVVEQDFYCKFIWTHGNWRCLPRNLSFFLFYWERVRWD